MFIKTTQNLCTLFKQHKVSILLTHTRCTSYKLEADDKFVFNLR